jgi:hypothetical protein
MENSHKEKSTMHLMSQYRPPKTPVEKMNDMTHPCVAIASLKILYEKPQKKTHKKRVQYDICNKLLIRETPPDTSKHRSKFIPMHSTHKKCGVW